MPSGQRTAVTQLAAYSSLFGHSSSPIARTPARVARAASAWRATDASTPPVSSTSLSAALTPFTSDTDGVYGNATRPPSIHLCFQSSSERNEPRGALGLSSIACQARSLTAISDIPGGPARHFCGPATARSTCQSSTRTSVPPSADTTSASISAPWSWASGPICAERVLDARRRLRVHQRHQLDALVLVEQARDVGGVDRLVVAHRVFDHLGAVVAQPVPEPGGVHAGDEVERGRPRPHERAGGGLEAEHGLALHQHDVVPGAHHLRELALGVAEALEEHRVVVEDHRRAQRLEHPGRGGGRAGGEGEVGRLQVCTSVRVS